MPFILKAISFLLWVVIGIVMVPCVFVVGHLYPLWAEWGENI